MKKVIVFDLDGTLAESKSQVNDRMAELIAQLLDKLEVCVISGGKFEQFETQFISNLKADPKKLRSLHIMPTCGTRYYLFDEHSGKWKIIYAEDFTAEQKKKIINVLNKVVDELGYKEKETWGEVIEDRNSQITFSALGQEIVQMLGKEGLKKKEEWDPDNKKKQAIANEASKLLPEFEVRVGGASSVDITRPGIDKAYGMRKLMDQLKINKKEILFIGDRLSEGGNDYPVKAMGIDSVEVSHWQETAKVVETILYFT
jgi:HAD superfamily hydrolase (TIGR01484 family)